MEGERKHITILHIDVKGSMDMAQALDPEQWYRVIEDYVQIVADAVHRFEGTMNQFTGDGCSRCSVRRSRMRITPSGPALPRSRSATQCEQFARRADAIRHHLRCPHRPELG